MFDHSGLALLDCLVTARDQLGALVLVLARDDLIGCCTIGGPVTSEPAYLTVSGSNFVHVVIV